MASVGITKSILILSVEILFFNFGFIIIVADVSKPGVTTKLFKTRKQY